MKIICAMIVLMINASAFAASSSSQQSKIQHVRFNMYGSSVVINYDLLGDPSAKYKVSLVLRKGSDLSFVYFPKELSGDIGIGRFVGQRRQIVWAISQEFPKGLEGNDFYFVVQAQEIEQKTNSQILTWIGSGVAVLAAAATFVILKNNKLETGSPTSSGLPSPLGQP